MLRKGSLNGLLNPKFDHSSQKILDINQVYLLLQHISKASCIFINIYFCNIQYVYYVFTYYLCICFIYILHMFLYIVSVSVF